MCRAIPWHRSHLPEYHHEQDAGWRNSMTMIWIKNNIGQIPPPCKSGDFTGRYASNMHGSLMRQGLACAYRFLQ